jgi:hypothetical protein
MKILSIVLSLCLTFNVLAASGTVSEFEKSLDSLQYSMTVEWDQKDQAVYEKITKTFFDEMEHMMASQQLSQEQVLAVLEKKVANKKALEAIKLKLSLMGKVNESQLSEVLKDNAKEMYSQGASWNGDIVTPVVIGVVVLAVGYLIWFHATHECNSYNTQYTCANTSEVYGTQCYYSEYCEFYVKNGEASN